MTSAVNPFRLLSIDVECCCCCCWSSLAYDLLVLTLQRACNASDYMTALLWRILLLLRNEIQKLTHGFSCIITDLFKKNQMGLRFSTSWNIQLHVCQHKLNTKISTSINRNNNKKVKSAKIMPKCEAMIVRTECLLLNLSTPHCCLT